jgi:hypothetical protein
MDELHYWVTTRIIADTRVVKGYFIVILCNVVSVNHYFLLNVIHFLTFLTFKKMRVGLIRQDFFSKTSTVNGSVGNGPGCHFLNGFSRKFLFVFLFYCAFVQEAILCRESRRRRGQTLQESSFHYSIILYHACIHP